MVLCLLNGGDYLPKCATFKFKQCWINYCRLKQRPENASRSIVSAVTPQEDSQGMDLKFLAEIVKVSALRESYHEVVWLDKKGYADNFIFLLNQSYRVLSTTNRGSANVGIFS
jgi:hypothetical protein